MEVIINLSFILMLALMLAFTFASHNDADPYGWHINCERFLSRRVEILMDDDLDRRTKYNLIGYLKSKVDGTCGTLT